jgi:hypothetical protein
MRLGRDDVSTLRGENARDCHFCLPEKVLRSIFDRFCRLPAGSGDYFNRKLAKRRKEKDGGLIAIDLAASGRDGGLSALRENLPAPRRSVRYCSACGAIWASIFGGLAAKPRG